MQKDRDNAALTTAYRACLRLQQLRTPDQLSKEISETVASLGYRRVNVYLIDEIGGLLKRFAPNSNNSTAQQGQRSPDRATVPLGDGLMSLVAKSGRGVHVGDLRREKRPYEGSDDVRSLICMPLPSSERVIGVLVLEDTKGNVFGERDQEIARILASQIAISIENSNLFSQVRRYAAEQEQRSAARTSELESIIAQLDETRVERKITVEALRLSDERYRSMVERLPIIIYTTERISSRRTLYVGPEVERNLGYSPTEWTSKTVLWFASLHPDDRDRVINDIAEAKMGTESTISMEYRLVSRNGETFWFRDEAAIVRDQGGRRFALEGLMLDITAQKLEVQSRLSRIEKLTKENNALQDQNESLSAFSHMVAHDLKNPLAILLGFAEVLKQDYVGRDDELLSQGIMAIVENALRMESIIDELLLLAEVQTVEEIGLEALDMASIVNETRTRLSHLISQNRATISIPAAWPTAIGHRPWVQEIWVNYLSNAIIHGGRPAEIELGAMIQKDGMARFWVQDNGPGISKENRERLFAPFTKLYEVQTEGHGLGLSIVHRIATKLGGDVGVESEPGVGSVFWFTLPIVQETQV